MIKNIFLVVLTAVVLFSCTPESEGGEVEANLTIQANSWKSIDLSTKLATAQKSISHYEFSSVSLQKLLADPATDYIWFDLGVNQNNEITFHATAVNSDGGVISKSSSEIIYNKNFKADFETLVRNKVSYSSERMSNPITGSHLLSYNDAYTYLDKVQKAFSNNFEDIFTYGDIRVERFGLEVETVREMIDEQNVASIALFFGINNEYKATTVFIGKNKYGQLLIFNTNGNVNAIRDFVKPCPPHCN